MWKDSKYCFLKSRQSFKGKAIHQILGLFNFLNVSFVNSVSLLLVFNKRSLFLVHLP